MPSNAATPFNRLVMGVGVVLLVLASLWTVLSRVGGAYWYTEFLGDQARDGFLIQGIADGTVQSLGPPASVGGYALPPLYYYFPGASSALLGADPRVHVLSNVVFSLAAFGLLLWTVWRLSSAAPRSVRWVIVGVVATVWSMLWTEFTLATREWNPSSMPFFLLVFTGLFEWLLRKHRDTPLVWYGNQAGAQRLGAWALLGLCIAVLCSLHSLTLFIVPVSALLLGAHLLWQVSARERGWAFIGMVIALLVSQLALLPYWIGEQARGFSNTQLIWKTIRDTSDKADYTPVAWLNHALEQWTTGLQAQFFPFSESYSLAALLGCVAAGGLLLAWSKHRDQLRPWGIVWLVFTFSAAQYQGELFMHYTLPTIFVVVFGAASLLALPWLQPQLAPGVRLALQGTLIILLTCSWQLQRPAFNHELEIRFGAPEQRRITTTELAHIIKRAEEGTQSGELLCVPQGYELSSQYIRSWQWHEAFDQRMVTTTSDCPAANQLFHVVAPPLSN